MLDGVVYKLKCKDENIKEFYVGSSCNLHQRKILHKNRCNSPKAIGYNLKVYRFIRDNGGWDNFEFEILLQVEVESKEELRLNYEAKYQLDLKPSLNSKVEGRTDKQYREDHKEQQKQYYEDHKEEISEKQKQYREDHKEEQKKYREDHKEEQKKYREDHKEEIKKYYQDHKEEILEKQKKYRDDNKQEISEYQKQYREVHKEKLKEKFKCDCGAETLKIQKKRHERTKKHKEFILSNYL